MTSTQKVQISRIKKQLKLGERRLNKARQMLGEILQTKLTPEEEALLAFGKLPYVPRCSECGAILPLGSLIPCDKDWNPIQPPKSDWNLDLCVKVANMDFQRSGGSISKSYLILEYAQLFDKNIKNFDMKGFIERMGE